MGRLARGVDQPRDTYIPEKARSLLSLKRDQNLQAGPGVGGAVEQEATAQEFDTLVEADEPVPTGLNLGRIEAASVVLHAQPYLVGHRQKVNGGVVGLGVAHHVMQGFLGDAVEAHFQAHRERPRPAGDLQMDIQPAFPTDLFDQHRQGVGQAAASQGRRPQIQDAAAGFFEVGAGERILNEWLRG